MSESPNDRNDRAIRIAAAWYMRRVPGMPIIVLTNDAENRRKALEMGINAMSVQVGTISHHNQFPINPYQAEPITALACTPCHASCKIPRHQNLPNSAARLHPRQASCTP